MKSLLTILSVFLLSSVIVYAQEEIKEIDGFTWENPSVNADGTPCDDLSVIRLYMSEISGEYIYHSEDATNNSEIAEIPQTPNPVEQYLLPSPLVVVSGKTYYFVATAEDNVGNESVPSEELMITIDNVAPNAPLNLYVIPNEDGTISFRIDRIPDSTDIVFHKYGK